MNFSPLTAWGDEMAIADWLKDPRTAPGLTASTIVARLRAGLSPEEALTRFVLPHRERTLTAFGHTLTLSEWLNQPEAAPGLTYEALKSRYKRGWSAESAISTPPGEKKR